MILATESAALAPGFDGGAMLVGLALLIGNGFFVAAEIALLAARRARVEELAEQGDPGAGRALAALRELSVTFSGAQLGITICSLGLGAVAEPALASALLGPLDAAGLPRGTASVIAFLVALGVVVFLHMVIGEMVPKNLALADAERLAIRLAGLFRLFVRLFRPLILGLNAAANALVRLTGVEPVEELGLVHTPDELRMALRESLRQGLLAPGEARVLSAVLALGEIDAEAAMTPRVDLVTIDAEAGVDEMLQAAVDSGYSRLPVRAGDLDHIVGVVHVKDLLIAEPSELEGRTAIDLMRAVPVVPESRDLDRLLDDMRRLRSHLALVVDEYGGTAGILTLEDILEELVGEIEDEFDTDTDRPSGRSGRWIVEGTMRRDELERLTGLRLAAEETETVSGAIGEVLGRLPAVGDEIGHEGWTIRVLTVDGRRAGRVEVTAPAR